MKKNSYSGKSEKDLVKALYEEREKLRTHRFGVAGSRSKNVKEGARTRKDIARILTALNANK